MLTMHEAIAIAMQANKGRWGETFLIAFADSQAKRPRKHVPR